MLFDEIGAGTDPKEGAALAEGIIDFVSQSDAKCIVTTHYSALKALAETNKKVENASMEFNRQTLQPTFKLRTGLPGSSYAIEVASRLGMPQKVLERAAQLVGTQERSLADLISRLENELIATDAERMELKNQLADAAALAEAYRVELEKLKVQEKELLQHGFAEANKLVEETRRKLDALIKELQQEKPDKTAIKEARRSFDDLKRDLAESAMPARKSLEPEEIPVPGDKVWIDRLQTDGELIEMISDGRRCKVRIGKVINTMEHVDLRKISSEKVMHSFPEGVNYQPFKQDVSMEVSLRGMTVEEARGRLDKYFDEIALANVPYVRIVHGKGTGALRRLVRDYLSKNKMVESFNLAEWHEGSWGVTIVKLKQ